MKNKNNLYRKAAEAAHKCLQHHHRGIQQFKKHKLFLQKADAIKSAYPSTVWIYVATIFSFGLIIAEMLVSSSTIQPITKNIFLNSTGWIHTFIVGLYGLILLILAMFVGKYLIVSPKQIQLKATLKSIAEPENLVSTFTDEVEQEVKYHRKYGIAALFFFVTLPVLIYIYRTYTSNGHQLGDIMSYFPVAIPLVMVGVITLLSSFKWVCTAHFMNWRSIKLSNKKLETHRKKSHQNALNCKQYLTHAEGLGLSFTHNAQITETLNLLETIDFSGEDFFSGELPRFLFVKVFQGGKPTPQISVKGWTLNGSNLHVFTNEDGEAKLTWKSESPLLSTIIIQGKYRLSGSHFTDKQRLTIHLEELKAHGLSNRIQDKTAQNGRLIPITENA